MTNQRQPPPADLAALALDEGFSSANEYTIALSACLLDQSLPLQVQTARLQALAGSGPAADQAAADELARHVLLLSAMTERFGHEAVAAAARGGSNAYRAVDAYVTAAGKSHRAVLASLSALKVLRDTPSKPAAYDAK